MTIQSQNTRVDYTGNGATTNFPVPFYWLQDSDLLVIRTDTAYTPPTVATLALGTDYVVTGSGNQSGGSITTTVAPLATQKLSILRNVPFTQLTHYVPNDPFPAASHEQALDKLTMETQQLNEGLSRSITLPPNATGLSAKLPLPAANNLIGWNQAANALQNVNPTTIATSVTYGNAVADKFSGDGTTVNFNLSANPGGINNLDVSISGVTQRPGIDYTWTAGTTLTFTTAPASGTNNILVRYTQALPIGTAAAGNVAFDNTTLDQQFLRKVNRVVDSIAALRGLSKTTYTRAFVTGYYAAGDGGGGAYYYDPTDTTSVDNGGTIIVASDGGRWKLEYQLVVSDKQFGCKVDGSTDDTAATQAAATAMAGKELYLSPGVRILSSVNFPNSITLRGAGPGATTIKTNSATADVFNVTGTQVIIEKMSFTSSVTRTAGAFVRFQSSCNKVTLRDFYMTNYFVGVRDTAAAESRIQFGTLFGPATAPGAGSAGILVDGGNDTYINQITMDAPAAQQPAAGIQITQTGALNITDCDIIHHTADLLINPGTGQSVAAVYALNSYFDTAVRGVSIAPTGNGVVIRCRFVACWTSSHTDTGFFVSSSSTGVLSGIELIGHHGFLNSANGVLINNGTTLPDSVKIIGGEFAQNGQSGIAIGAGVNNFSIIGAHSGAYAGLSGNGNWGILISAGSANQYIVQGNHLLGNTGGTISDGGTGLTKFIGSNIGTAGVQTVPTVGASPWTYTNSVGKHQTAYINGGTVSIVSVNGSNVFTQTNCTVRIPPGQSMTITYSSAPGVGITTDA